MKIIQCDASHNAQWNAYVQASPRASFYHRAEWREIYEQCFGHQTAYLAAFDADRIVGVFPLVRLKSMLFGNIACSLPFMNYGGPAGDTTEIEAALVDAAAQIAAKWRVDYVEIRSRHHHGDRFPTADHKVSLTVELGPDPTALFNSYAGDHRREIRKGHKNGYTAKFGNVDLVNDFYAIMSQSWRDLGTPIFAESYIREICAKFGPAIRICVIYDAQGNPAATAFDGLHNGTVEGMWLGIGSDHKRQGAGYVLYWELIKHACEAGYARHHLGRSSVNSGAEQFKKKWNATSVQLYWQYILLNRSEMPALNPDNPKYQLAIKTWQKLPLMVTRMLGPLISRSIP